ncbi:MAG: hypothetical protein AAFU85_31830, partial [Planctomycetota bacterium]
MNFGSRPIGFELKPEDLRQAATPTLQYLTSTDEDRRSSTGRRSLLVTLAARGMGKSYFFSVLHEFLLRFPAKFVPIQITFNYHSSYSAMVDGETSLTNAAKSLACRAAFSFFVAHSAGDDWQDEYLDFRECWHKSLVEVPTLDAVIFAIKDELAQKYERDDVKPTIVLFVDEAALAGEEENEKQAQNIKNVYQVVTQTMDDRSRSSSPVCALMSGVDAIVLRNITTPTAPVTVTTSTLRTLICDVRAPLADDDGVREVNRLLAQDVTTQGSVDDARRELLCRTVTDLANGHWRTQSAIKTAVENFKPPSSPYDRSTLETKFLGACLEAGHEVWESYANSLQREDASMAVSGGVQAMAVLFAASTLDYPLSDVRDYIWVGETKQPEPVFRWRSGGFDVNGVDLSFEAPARVPRVSLFFVEKWIEEVLTSSVRSQNFDQNVVAMANTLNDLLCLGQVTRFTPENIRYSFIFERFVAHVVPARFLAAEIINKNLESVVIKANRIPMYLFDKPASARYRSFALLQGFESIGDNWRLATSFSRPHAVWYMDKLPTTPGVRFSRNEDAFKLELVDQITEKPDIQAGDVLIPAETNPACDCFCVITIVDEKTLDERLGLVVLSVKWSANKSVKDGVPVTSSKLELRHVKDGITKMKRYFEDRKSKHDAQRAAQLELAPKALAKLKSKGNHVDELFKREIASILVCYFNKRNPNGNKEKHVKALKNAIAANPDVLASVGSAATTVDALAPTPNDVHVEVRAPVGPKVKLFGLEFASRDICLA